MQKDWLVLIFTFFLIQATKAQFNQYCGSLRYDTEVFHSVQKTSDVIYGSNISSSGAITSLTLDVYEPVDDTIPNRPLIIWVHGGSFIGGTKADGDVVSLCEHFAKRGYVCASINYRLGFSIFPPNPVTAAQTVFRAVQDMKAAIRFFRKDAATADSFHINPSLIFGGGSSAGAFTALHLAYLDQPSEIPAGIDTTVLGGIEGNSGNPGYSSTINAVINLCGALGDKTWMHENDIPFAAMHGDRDRTVPYNSDTIFLLGVYPVTVVDGSYSISEYSNSIGLANEMYTYYGADHVPYISSVAYMDTTVRFVSNFLYKYMGCFPLDPSPLANTFLTGINSVLNENEISIYPNPGNGLYKFNFSIFQIINQFLLYDVCGKKMKEFNNLEISTILDLSDFNHGIYFFRIEIGDKFFSGKLIKQD